MTWFAAVRFGRLMAQSGHPAYHLMSPFGGEANMVTTWRDVA